MHLLSSHLGAFGVSGPRSHGETRLVSWAIPRSNLSGLLGGIRFSYQYLLCSVLQALPVYTLLYESDDLFGLLQCLVFLLFLSLDDLAQLLHFFYHHLSTSHCSFIQYDVLDVEGYLFIIFLIDILNATKEVESEKIPCRLFLLHGTDMQLVTWIMI
jgi:hypothetical protein